MAEQAGLIFMKIIMFVSDSGNRTQEKKTYTTKGNIVKF